MQSVLCLTEGIGHGKAMLALTRLVMETTITIRHLVMHGNQEMYDGHVPQVGVTVHHPDQLSAGSLQQHLLA